MKNIFISVLLTSVIFGSIAWAFDMLISLLESRAHQSYFEWIFLMAIASTSGILSSEFFKYLARRDKCLKK